MVEAEARTRIIILRSRKALSEKHMRAVGLAVLPIIALLLAGTAAAWDQDRQWKSCAGGTSPDVVIGACTAIIQSGQESTEGLADAFNNRGDAYNDKREYDPRHPRPRPCDQPRPEFSPRLQQPRPRLRRQARV